MPGFPGTGIHSSDIMYEYCHVKDSTHNDDDVLGLRAYSMGSFKHSVNGCQWRTQWGSQPRSDKETLDTPSERCLASLSACRSACVCVCVCVCLVQGRGLVCVCVCVCVHVCVHMCLLL